METFSMRKKREKSKEFLETEKHKQTVETEKIKQQKVLEKLKFKADQKARFELEELAKAKITLNQEQVLEKAKEEFQREKASIELEIEKQNVEREQERRKRENREQFSVLEDEKRLFQCEVERQNMEQKRFEEAQRSQERVDHMRFLSVLELFMDFQNGEALTEFKNPANVFSSKARPKQDGFKLSTIKRQNKEDAIRFFLYADRNLKNQIMRFEDLYKRTLSAYIHVVHISKENGEETRTRVHGEQLKRHVENFRKTLTLEERRNWDSGSRLQPIDLDVFPTLIMNMEEGQSISWIVYMFCDRLDTQTDKPFMVTRLEFPHVKAEFPKMDCYHRTVFPVLLTFTRTKDNVKFQGDQMFLDGSKFLAIEGKILVTEYV